MYSGKVCFLKDDIKKEKYIIIKYLYSDEVVQIIGIGINNKGIYKELRTDFVELDLETQQILDNL